MAPTTPLQYWVVPEGTPGEVVGIAAEILQGNFAVGSVVHVVQSSTKPNGEVGGPFASFNQAQSAANQLNGAITNATSKANPANTPVNPLTGIDAIGSFFNKLGEKNTWVRVGEAVVGLILLDVGLKAFTRTSLIEKTAKTAGKAALMVK